MLLKVNPDACEAMSGNDSLLSGTDSNRVPAITISKVAGQTHHSIHVSSPTSKSDSGKWCLRNNSKQAKFLLRSLQRSRVSTQTKQTLRNEFHFIAFVLSTGI